MADNPKDGVTMAKQLDAMFGKAVNFVVGEIVAEFLPARGAEGTEGIAVAPGAQGEGKVQLFHRDEQNMVVFRERSLGCPLQLFDAKMLF